jgi:hypothetical protein
MNNKKCVSDHKANCVTCKEAVICKQEGYRFDNEVKELVNMMKEEKGQ